MNTLLKTVTSNQRSGSISFSIEVRNDTVVISRMPVTPGILNPFGIVQAGAMLWLADVTASILVVENHPLDKKGAGFPLAIDIHTSLVGNQKEGDIKAEARFVHKGRNVFVVRTRVSGNNEKLLAEITSTHIPAK
jgi:1,4-dihydroxy-2-naphthoyl-CoA hydrolase